MRISSMYPAISAEDSDFMDAMTGRSYGMLIQHPWRCLMYSIFSFGYFAISYVFIGLFIFLSVWLTHKATGTFASAHFEHVFPEPTFGELIYEPNYDALAQYKSNWGLSTVATIIQIQIFAFIGLLGAFAISFFFTASSRAYLLLRQASFGSGFDDIHVEVEPPPAPSADEKPGPTKDPVVESDSETAQTDPSSETTEEAGPDADEDEPVPGAWKNSIEAPAPLPEEGSP